MRRIVDLAHSAGALAWADAVHYGPHGQIDCAAWDVDVLICSPYKFFGPHLGLAFGRRDLLAGWRPYKVRPAPDDPVGARFELGTMQHELLAGFVAAVVGRFARPGATEQAVRSAAGVAAAIVAVVLLLPTVTELDSRRLQADRSRDVGAQLAFRRL